MRNLDVDAGVLLVDLLKLLIRHLVVLLGRLLDRLGLGEVDGARNLLFESVIALDHVLLIEALIVVGLVGPLGLRIGGWAEIAAAFVGRVLESNIFE